MIDLTCTNILLFFTFAFCSTCSAWLPETHLPVPDIIRHWGYPVETHEVLTNDGYYLTLHRIPYGTRDNNTDGNTKRPVFFLQHGLLDSSAAWVLNLPHQSLGFLLADHGMDVWMGNVRGNSYSKRHVTLNPESAKFWEFCFDDMAKYDFPAMINYALNHTGQSELTYVGYSQGTIMAFAALSENQALQEKVKMFFAMAPVTRMSHVTDALKRLAYLSNKIQWLFEFLGINEFLPNSQAMKKFNNYLCYYLPYICELGVSLVSGFDMKNMNSTRLPVYTSHFPAGTSTKNMLHYMQLINTGLFQKYDFGFLGNILKYTSAKPPEYDVSAIRVPTVLISGSADWLSTPKDVKWTAAQMEDNIYKDIKLDGYNHIDFIWAISAHKRVYRKILFNAWTFNGTSNV